MKNFNNREKRVGKDNLNYDFTFFKNLKFLKSKDIIHPLNLKLLKNYLNSAGNIVHRIFSRCTRKQHRSIEKAIKRARILGLLSFGI